MKASRFILSLCAAFASLTQATVAEERELEVIGGDRELLRAWTIEDLYKAVSADDRLSVTIVASTAGHTCNCNRLVATIWDDSPIEGEYANSTTFDLGRVNLLEPPVRLEKVKDRLYRLSYRASVSDTLESASLDFTYHLHLAEDNRLTRVVPALEFSSFWDMEGSKMGLVASGANRSIYYVEPTAGSKAAPGTLFFNGTAEGNAYRGKVLNWRWKIPGDTPQGNSDEGALTAEGEIQDDGRTVVLHAWAMEWNGEKEVPVGPRRTHTLRFKSVAPPQP